MSLSAWLVWMAIEWVSAVMAILCSVNRKDKITSASIMTAHLRCGDLVSEFLQNRLKDTEGPGYQ